MKQFIRFLPQSLQRTIKQHYYVRLLDHYQEHDWEASAILKALIPPGSCVLDVGANIGYITALLRRWVGTDGKVFAFEPIPETFSYLAHSIHRLKWSNVFPLNYALSSGTGTKTMVTPTYKQGHLNFYESRIVDDQEPESLGGVSWRIESRTIDALFFQSEDKIAFIKIDVEGHEMDTLRGGEQIIQRDHPVLYIEVAYGPDPSASEVFHWLKKRGYPAYIIKQDKIVPRLDDHTAVDYLFVHESQMATSDLSSLS